LEKRSHRIDAEILLLLEGKLTIGKEMSSRLS